MFSSILGRSTIALLVYRTEGAAILAVGSGIAMLLLAGLTLLIGTN